jgi:hypothetical protein
MNRQDLNNWLLNTGYPISTDFYWSSIMTMTWVSNISVPFSGNLSKIYALNTIHVFLIFRSWTWILDRGWYPSTGIVWNSDPLWKGKEKKNVVVRIKTATNVTANTEYNFFNLQHKSVLRIFFWESTTMKKWLKYFTIKICHL